MNIETITLDTLYDSLKGIISKPLPEEIDINNNPFLLEAVKTACYYFAKINGWTFNGKVPSDIKKAVIILAPHTSRWDLIYAMAGYKFFRGIKGSYLAKKELFKFPLKKIYEETGGIPVDRSQSKDLVQKITELFNKRPIFYLTLAPEGTRGKTNTWKSGFYNIAKSADVPILMAYVDYGKKEIGIGGVVYPSGNKKKDFKKIESFYKKITPKHPDLWNWRII